MEEGGIRAHAHVLAEERPARRIGTELGGRAVEDLTGCDHVGRVDPGVVGEIGMSPERTQPGGGPTLVDQ